MDNAAQLDAAMDYNRDYDYDYFGFKTLERSYLLRANGKIVERPQHMLMRVSVGIHKTDVARAIETYNLLSQRCAPRRAAQRAAALPWGCGYAADAVARAARRSARIAARIARAVAAPRAAGPAAPALAFALTPRNAPPALPAPPLLPAATSRTRRPRCSMRARPSRSCPAAS